MKIVFASSNQGKIHELDTLLKDMDLQCVPQATLGVEDIEETGLTFVENALLKARHAAKVTGMPALADDSGLIVDALNGAPGIYSARYAGKNATAQLNNEKLLTALKEIPKEHRTAAFCCVLVFVLSADDPRPLICEGIWRGIVLEHPKGENGFGYDPVFYDAHYAKSAAELPLNIKNTISHRGQALQLLLKKLPEKLCLHSQ